MTSEASFPRFRPVAAHGLLVEFGRTIGLELHEAVRRLDAALARRPFEGFTEAVPAYTSLFVGFDPLCTDHATVRGVLESLIEEDGAPGAEGGAREVLVCYDDDFAPDLPEVAKRSGLSPEAVVSAHLAGDYRVFLYGFAPGYAYLAGVPEAIRLPRKPTAERDRPAGSLLIAGPQCLVTTLPMPTGWWIIGRSPTPILREDDVKRPFLFDVGDRVRFRRIDRAAYEAAESRR